MNGRYELLPTLAAHRQPAQVPSVDPLGVMQHLHHLPEREQRIPVAPRRDTPDRAQRVQRDEIERVAARLATRAAHRGRAVLHVRVEEGGHRTLLGLAPAEGED